MNTTIANNMNATLPNTMNPTPSNVLIFGGTGFIGKVVLERLLVESKSTMYLLVRSKRGTSPEERFEKLRKLPCFQNVQEEFDNGRVQLIPGDVTLPNLGLTDDNRKLLVSRVTHILSLAACTDFDLPIATAATSNTVSALSILDLAKECKQLESYVHCSTAYVVLPGKNNSPLCEEHVTTFSNGKASQVYNRIMNGVTKEEETLMLKETGYPNTYNYTKALAETLLVERRDTVPLTIVRPSCVIACFQHPLPGWIDSKTSLTAFIAMYGSGFLHTIPAKSDTKPDVVPCDYVANRMIHAAFGDIDRTSSQVQVIHATSGLENAVTGDEIVEMMGTFFKPKRRHTQQRPFLRIMAESSNPKIAKSFAKDKRRVKALQFTAKVFRQKKVAHSLGKVAGALDKLEEVLSFFTHNTFNFHSKETINDVMPCFDRDQFYDLVHQGIYHYLLGGEEKPMEPIYRIKDSSASDACSSTHCSVGTEPRDDLEGFITGSILPVS